MRIQVKRTGGFAGIEKYAELDTVGRTDAAQWDDLVERALADGRSEPPVGVPDGFTYQITIGDRTVYCADPRLTDPQRKLITQVLKEGS